MSKARNFKMGTRGSLLARTQSGLITRQVEELLGASVAEIIIRTEGDDTSTSLTKAAKPGVFVSALRDALLAGEVDFIVHSFKDLPSAPIAGIALAAVPAREDLRDVLVSRGNLGLANLPAGSVVGTSSPRRAARILFARPDLVVKPIRGNIDTRIGKVQTGEYDATVLAAAGLKRVDRLNVATEFFDLNLLLPAPAQGALAIECRSDDSELLEVLAKLNDASARLVTTAERAVLVGIAATCATAIGAVAQVVGKELSVVAELSDETTNEHERVEVSVNLTTDTYADSASISEAYQAGMFAAHKLMDTQLGKRLGAND